MSLQRRFEPGSGVEAHLGPERVPLDFARDLPTSLAERVQDG